MISNLPVKSTNNDFAEIWRCYLTDLRFCTGGLPAVVQSCTWSSSYHQTVPSLTQAAGVQWPCRRTDWSSSVQLSEPCLSHTLTHQPMPENKKIMLCKSSVGNAFAICTPTNAFLFYQTELSQYLIVITLCKSYFSTFRIDGIIGPIYCKKSFSKTTGR